MPTKKGDKFEMLVADEYKSKGYDTLLTRQKDHGVDIIISKNGNYSAVQCKHTKKPVPREVFQKLDSAMRHHHYIDNFGRHYQFNRGIVVSTGGFTKDAISWVKENNSRYGYRKFIFVRHDPIDEDINKPSIDQDQQANNGKQTHIAKLIILLFIVFIFLASWLYLI